MNSPLDNLLACAFSTCIINADYADVAVEYAIEAIPHNKLFNELRLGLPAYMSSEVDHKLVRDVCEKMTLRVWPSSDRLNIEGLLMASYGKIILRSIDKKYRFVLCHGCRDDHSSQAHHTCITMNPTDQLQECFLTAFMMLNREDVISDFFCRLSKAPDVLKPEKASFHQLVEHAITTQVHDHEVDTD